jgi:hypothetical protein
VVSLVWLSRSLQELLKVSVGGILISDYNSFNNSLVTSRLLANFNFRLFKVHSMICGQTLVIKCLAKVIFRKRDLLKLIIWLKEHFISSVNCLLELRTRFCRLYYVDVKIIFKICSRCFLINNQVLLYRFICLGKQLICQYFRLRSWSHIEGIFWDFWESLLMVFSRNLCIWIFKQLREWFLINILFLLQRFRLLGKQLICW